VFATLFGKINPKEAARCIAPATKYGISSVGGAERRLEDEKERERREDPFCHRGLKCPLVSARRDVRL
jgi:hypothetical protein